MGFNKFTYPCEQNYNQSSKFPQISRNNCAHLQFSRNPGPRQTQICFLTVYTSFAWARISYKRNIQCVYSLVSDYFTHHHVFWDSFMLLHSSGCIFHSLLLPSSIPSYEYTTIWLSLARFLTFDLVPVFNCDE